MLKSFSSIEEAIRITGKIKEFCKKEEFNLSKFSEDKDRQDDVKNKDLAIGVFAEDKALGVCQMECRRRHSGLSNKNE